MFEDIKANYRVKQTFLWIFQAIANFIFKSHLLDSIVYKIQIHRINIAINYVLNVGTRCCP